MFKKRISIFILVLALAMLGCNAPGQGLQGLAATLAALSLTQTAQATLGSGAALPASTQPPPSATAAPGATSCAAMVTANLNANIRTGPSTAYDAVGSLLTGQTAPIAGNNSDGTWWYINFPAGPGGYGWIA